MDNKTKFYINGKWVDPLEGSDFEVINQWLEFIEIGSHTIGDLVSDLLLYITDEKSNISLQEKKDLQTLEHEFYIMKKLKNNSYTSCLKWFGQDKDYIYIVMNLLGNSLEHIKRIKSILPFDSVRGIALQIINIIEYFRFGF